MRKIVNELSGKNKTVESEQIRLNRYLAMCGICSRREADALIAEGRVRVDGNPAGAGMKVTGSELVLVDGKPVHPVEKEIVLAVNKPVGVVCSTDRRWGDVLIEDIVKSEERLFYVGRLDKDSEGLILMTNQGALADAMMRGRSGHEKEYVVQVDRPVTEVFLNRMRRGVYLEELDVMTRPCRAWKTDERTCHIVLTQGLNRQIRRMCQALGSRVRSLKRIRILNIQLAELKSGESREITGQELAQLKRQVCGEDQTGGRS